MTGIAAILVNGTTLHALGGLGGSLQKMEDFERMLSSPACERWEEMGVLLIDEVSMLSAELFSALERGARLIRGNTKPWGGLQIVVCGDFHQLPPIVGGKGKEFSPQNPFLNRGYAFQSPAWKRSRMHTVELTQVFRQSEAEFVAHLQCIREGRANAAAALAALAQRCARPLPVSSGIKPTELYATNKQVGSVNEDELRRLPGVPKHFMALDEATLDPDLRGANGRALTDAEEHQFRVRARDARRARAPERSFSLRRLRQDGLRKHEFFRSCMATEQQQLKAGAQVMLLVNLELGSDASRSLANGRREAAAAREVQHAMTPALTPADAPTRCARRQPRLRDRLPPRRGMQTRASAQGGTSFRVQSARLPRTDRGGTPGCSGSCARQTWTTSATGCG